MQKLCIAVDLIFNDMKLKTILEMPHAEYNNLNFGLVDFRMEKYNLPKETIHQLMVAFHKMGVVGKSTLTDTWLFFNDNETRKASDGEVGDLLHLPDDWENYLLNMQ